MRSSAEAAQAHFGGVGGRAALLGLLLLLEYLALSFMFDARALHAQAGPLAVFGLIGEFATIAMLAGAATLILMGGALRDELAAVSGQRYSAPRLGVLALVHAAVYAALVLVTARLFGAPERASLLIIVSWLSLAVLAPLTLLPIAMPLGALRAVMPRLLMALLVGGGAGLGAWLMGQLSATLWRPMGGTVLQVVIFLLSKVGQSVLVDAQRFIVGTERFRVALAPQCSGFEGMGLMVVFLGGYVLLNRERLRLGRAVPMIGVAVLATWLLNAVRVAALILIGHYVSPQIALGGFHSKAGWLMFCLVAFGFVVAMRRSRWLAHEPEPTVSAPHQEREQRGEDNPTAVYLMPLLALLLTMLVTGLFVAEFDHFYPLRVIAVAAVLLFYRHRYRSLLQPVSWEAPAIGVAVYLLWIAMVARDGPSTLGESLSSLSRPHAIAWVVFRVVGSVVLVPIAEELAFRGYLLRRLIDRDFSAVPLSRISIASLAGSSLAFGLMHSSWMAATLAGGLYALAQARHGRLSDAIVAHAVTNGLIAADVLLLGSWGLWG